MFPAASETHVVTTRRKMQLEFTSLAIQLHVHRELNGEFPQRLDQLDAEAPLDLFTMDPLRYEIRDGGVVVNSVGQNRTDDGGPIPEVGSDDLGFELRSRSS